MNSRTQFILSGLTIGLCIIVLGAINFGGFLLIRKEQVAAQAQLDRTHQHLELINLTQVNFKIQVQEWKNILLRGHKPADFERYFAQFAQREQAVFSTLESLIADAALPDSSRALASEALSQLRANGDLYRQALAQHAITDPSMAFVIDRQVRGIDRPPMERLNALNNEIAAQSAEIRQAASTQLQSTVSNLIGVSAICLCFGIALTTTFLIDRRKFEKALADSSAAAERANKAKSNFLAHMSHEIRTPMNGITAAVDLLKGADLSPDIRESVDIMDSSVESLVVIVNDILDISKIEAGHLVLHPDTLALNPFLEILQKTIAPLAKRKQLELTFDWPRTQNLHIHADAVRLRQVLLNLLSNAIKFTDKGSVSLQVTAQEGPEVGSIALQFAVKDTGIGIPESKQDLLFKAFSQVDESPTRRHHGTGLGLVICKAIAKSMNGHIALQSTFRQGSTFTLHFVAKAIQPQRAAAENVVGQITPTKRRLERILLVDDVATNRVMGQRLLQRLGLQSNLAADGAEALAMAQAQAYDLILMDCQMPVMDGYAATRQIRALQSDQPPVIVAMTAHAMAEHRAEAKAAGMDAHLSKPIRLTDLHGLLSQFFELPAFDNQAPPPANTSKPTIAPSATQRLAPNDSAPKIKRHPKAALECC